MLLREFKEKIDKIYKENQSIAEFIDVNIDFKINDRDLYIDNIEELLQCIKQVPVEKLDKITLYNILASTEDISLSTDNVMDVTTVTDYEGHITGVCIYNY